MNQTTFQANSFRHLWSAPNTSSKQNISSLITHTFAHYFRQCYAWNQHKCNCEFKKSHVINTVTPSLSLLFRDNVNHHNQTHSPNKLDPFLTIIYNTNIKWTIVTKPTDLDKITMQTWTRIQRGKTSKQSYCHTSLNFKWGQFHE